MMKIRISPEDDPEFVAIVRSILHSISDQEEPRILTAIQIDNWFDHKWLKFSGKLMGALGWWTADLTLPPFNPNRVKSQIVCQRTEDGSYEEIEAEPLHIHQTSEQNRSRKVSRETDSGVFAWWTSNTVTNRRGALMVYTQIGEESSAWYVSFEKVVEWRINKTEGIGIVVVNKLWTDAKS